MFLRILAGRCIRGYWRALLARWQWWPIWWYIPIWCTLRRRFSLPSCWTSSNLRYFTILTFLGKVLLWSAKEGVQRSVGVRGPWKHWRNRDWVCRSVHWSVGGERNTCKLLYLSQIQNYTFRSGKFCFLLSASQICWGFLFWVLELFCNDLTSLRAKWFTMTGTGIMDNGGMIW